MAELVLSREEARALDRRAIEEFGVPSIVLMENAGRMIASGVRPRCGGVRMVICCGKGNNGGDGFVIARYLDNYGAPVRVLLFAPPEELSGDAAINYRIIAKSGVPVTIYTASFDRAALQRDLAAADHIVDALLGTGLTGPVQAPLADVISAINASGVRITSVDIPSGLDCDTGRPLGVAVRAKHTMSLVGIKKGFLQPEASEWVGLVHVVNIGLPRALLAGFSVACS